MGYTFRLATEADIEALLELTTRAYEPIRELGIQFQAAHADFALVQKNVQKNLCYVMEENGELLSTLSLRMPWESSKDRSAFRTFGGLPQNQPPKKGQALSCWNGWKLKC